MKAVFDTRPDTGYDDDIIRRYHFPNRYLSEARKSIEDWIVYREPRRGGGRQGYVAVARVTDIEPDRSEPGSSYVHLTDFLSFDDVVPLHSGTRYYETRLNTVTKPSRIGVALQGKSIRTISDAEFGAIALAGFAETLAPARTHRPEHGESQVDVTLQGLVGVPQEEQERRIVRMLVNRPLRDAAFRTSVVKAYGEMCAVTRLRIVNGRGQGRGAGSAHLEREGRRAGHRPERRRALGDLPLALRPSPHQPDGRVRAARGAQPGAKRVAEPLRWAAR